MNQILLNTMNYYHKKWQLIYQIMITLMDKTQFYLLNIKNYTNQKNPPTSLKDLKFQNKIQESLFLEKSKFII